MLATERESIEKCLVSAMDHDINLITNLQQKYGLAPSIFEYAIVLLEQKNDIKRGYYWVERESIDESTEKLTAYFKNGKSYIARRALPIHLVRHMG